MTRLYSHGLTVEEVFAPQVRCSYPSKVCTNPRAIKLCGSLHKLCEFHRKKANTNQKRLQQRRRVIRAQMAERSPVNHTNADARYENAPVMQMNLTNLLTTDLPTSKTTMMTSKQSDTFSTSIDELSVFETDFLDSFVFGGNVRELSAAPTGDHYENYATVDQAQSQFEPFSFELQL